MPRSATQRCAVAGARTTAVAANTYSELAPVPERRHIPVMLPEVLRALDVKPGGAYVDANLGEGGHTEAILQANAPDGTVLGIDADAEAITSARGRLAGSPDLAGRMTTANANFRDIADVSADHGHAVGSVDGVLFDLGLSSLQLDTEQRGFSFRRPDPLDMRFDVRQSITAGDIVNRYDRDDLADVIYQYGEERSSRRVAAAIVAARPLQTASQLADVIASAMPRRGGRSRIHPATKTFQALRIAVNDELGALEDGLNQAISLLKPGGRVVVIAYHSLEDRIVKNLFRREATDCICPPERPICDCGHTASVTLVSRRVIKPSEAEIDGNPRSRSARLRAVERL
ncbi:MAG: 16S rRNA (cytosine(1402)-N(4))-methyltransferase RsmH [Chloroflexi bacterium]|jgi:16S rRNA (cytosine1402-N4)-methyltransferase|nr:16S rRNA (cytosine(1402)-N(4))-methyltransferase RsmH [Chloroflexota bacterium]MBT4074767.1 16S rRNA (cytosine(1402)-N(4))-methyltransferase RsmH [Chloroflexota bacterium]MBT5318511.1 16S rRNA (cytosine(1402)-N(4))-methyltransferase RsmH [Chloroflexota bacterium]MBT6681920.1 16S rRNA (cytosine(1402)-N(4))-methyltransferase RsmH [Chloroflexota bacterium]